MISIIVPIYNVEGYLVPCINSILASTYIDFELILVDDGSPDRCGEICDSYAAQDNRIKVIHQSNEGLSCARNSGLRVASGDYIAFVDSDDCIHPQMLEVLYDTITSGDYDFSMVYATMTHEGDDITKNVSEISEIDISHPIVIDRATVIQNLGDLGTSAYQYHVVWNKLYKRSLIEGIGFKSIASEDLEWMNRICHRMTHGALVEKELYYYLQRNNSLMNADSLSRKIDVINTYYECLKETPLNMPTNRAIMLKALYSMIFGCRNNYRNSPRLLDEVNVLAAKVYKETKTELLHSDLSLSRKLRILCLYHFPGLYALLMKLRYGL